MSDAKSAAVSLADIVQAMFTRPAPGSTSVEPSEAAPSNPPAEPRQITAPTPADLEAVQALAHEAGTLFDEIEELVGTKVAELAEKKAELKERMLGHGLKEVVVPGRQPIVLATKRDKKATKKAISTLLTAEEAAKLWANLPVETSHYISIPPRNPPEA